MLFELSYFHGELTNWRTIIIMSLHNKFIYTFRNVECFENLKSKLIFYGFSLIELCPSLKCFIKDYLCYFMLALVYKQQLLYFLQPTV